MLQALVLASAAFLFSNFAHAQNAETFEYDGFNVYIEMNITNAFGGGEPAVDNLQINYVPIFELVRLRRTEHVRSENIKGISYSLMGESRRIEIQTDSPQFHKIVIYTWADGKKSDVLVYSERGLFFGRRRLGVYPLRCGANFAPTLVSR